MKIENLIKSKTLWAGLATVCTGIGMYVAGEQSLQELVIAVIGIVFTTLRFFTDKSLSDK